MRSGIRSVIAAAVAATAFVACAPTGVRTVFAEFHNVGDLVNRSNVQQSDAVVGSVRGIELVERDGRWLARVELRVRGGTPLPPGTRAVVRSTSLLGEKYVDLVQPRGAVGEELPDGAVIPVERTGKAPEVEDLFIQIGAILEGGALEDLARLITATAVIVEGQEDNIGRVLDQTARLVSSLHAERESLASALDDLASASRTFAEGSQTIARSLEVSDGALGLVASQARELEDLIVQLDRVAQPLGELTRAHRQDIDAQVRAVNNIVPRLHEARGTLEAAVEKLPVFTRLFAEAIPGDYVQLDVLVDALPIEASASSGGSLEDLLLEAAR